MKDLFVRTESLAVFKSVYNKKAQAECEHEETLPLLSDFVMKSRAAHVEASSPTCEALSRGADARGHASCVKTAAETLQALCSEPRKTRRREDALSAALLSFLSVA